MELADNFAKGEGMKSSLLLPLCLAADHRPILPGVSQRVGRFRPSRMPMHLAGIVSSMYSSQGVPPFIKT
jgi:hypothetical protein